MKIKDRAIFYPSTPRAFPACVCSAPTPSSPPPRLVGGVGDAQAPHQSEGRKLVLAGRRRSYDVQYPVAPHHERIADKRPVAPPRHRLGAHQCARLRFRQLHRPLEPLFKFLRPHVIGESAKARIVPAEVSRIRLGVPQSAQLFQVNIRNSRGTQLRPERIAIELRIVTRARHGADIDYATNPIRFEKLNELRERARGMSDSENRLLLLRFLWHGHWGFMVCAAPARVQNSAFFEGARWR